MTDRRVRYTRMVLKNALLELLADKPINKTTIKEICELADVNRGTFYTHYTDQYDLLQDIQDEFAEQVAELHAQRRSSRLDTLQMLTELLEYCRQQQPLCSILFTTSGNDDLVSHLIEDAYAEFRQTRNSPGLPEWQLSLVYTFIASGSTAIIRQWAQDGMEQDPGDVARLMVGLAAHGSSFPAGQN